jgi:hypothetical protein
MVADPPNAPAWLAHQSSKVRGGRPSSRLTVPVRNPVVSARMRANPSRIAPASAGGAPPGVAGPEGLLRGAGRRQLEDKVTADLTEIEREHLLTALAKIHRSASDMLGRPADHAGPAAG